MKAFVDVLSRDRWLRLAIVSWFVLAVILTVKGTLQPNRRSVYGCFTAGARDFWSCQETYGRNGYYYGPTFAMAFSPFAYLPDPVGATLWNWLNVATFVYALCRFHREVLSTRWPQISLGAFLCLTLIGAARSLYSAQSNALLIAFILLAVVELLQRRWWRAAFCLALPVHIKIWPIAIAGLMILRYPRRLLIRWTLFMAMLAAAPMLTHSPAYVARYYGMWQKCLAERQGDAQRWPGYRDAWTIWETIVGPVNKHVYTIVQLSAAGTLAAWCLLSKYRGQEEGAALWSVVGLWAVWQMLLGPGSERLTLIIVAPCAAWLLLRAFQEKQGRLLATIAFALVFILGTGEVERRLLLVTPWAPAAFPLGILLLGISLAWPHVTVERLLNQLRRAPVVPSVALVQQTNR